ncbi:MAG: topoisomerase DNA-binding C4 zinc finger domain-containing protein, partial [Candidatus Dormibacteraeota bacterium]|nr:topoisomerase DNA-binding C4 zinc finger domain-containing protein [Candidatus Dormibacteraeota bacterium]
YRANKTKDGKPRAEPKVLDEQCPVCGKSMVEREGRYGTFKSCSDYPKCRGGTKSGGRKKQKAEV